MKMDKPPTADRKAYYAQAETWSQEVHGTIAASRRLAWTVAGAACVVAVLEAFALIALAPLKTVVPYTITVDRQTGYIETAQALRPGALSQDMAVTQAFLAQYVLARETFDVTDLQAKYREVAAWTAGPARDQYVKAMQRSNPQSPVNLNDATTTVRVTIKSVSVMSKTSALVRFDAERGTAGGPAMRQSYAAVVGFRYTGQPMRAEDRFLNPLGFQVTTYRRDAETAAPVPVVGVTP
jgi:type IV secretion system protein VirB8